MMTKEMKALTSKLNKIISLADRAAGKLQEAEDLLQYIYAEADEALFDIRIWDQYLL
jgi:hypothetical protein